MFNRIKAICSYLGGGIMGGIVGCLFGPFAVMGNCTVRFIFVIRDMAVYDPDPLAGLLLGTCLIVALPFEALFGLFYGAARGIQLGLNLGFKQSFLGVIKELFTYNAFEYAHPKNREMLISYRYFRPIFESDCSKRRIQKAAETLIVEAAKPTSLFAQLPKEILEKVVASTNVELSKKEANKFARIEIEEARRRLRL